MSPVQPTRAPVQELGTESRKLGTSTAAAAALLFLLLLLLLLECRRRSSTTTRLLTLRHDLASRHIQPILKKGEKAPQGTLSPEASTTHQAINTCSARSHSRLLILTSSRIDVIRRVLARRPLGAKRLSPPLN